ncbi:hypothetical protein INT47_000062 [Mucor saturninus]|uniref:MoaB/Mog domain-containing protein n=1 Tax=Mucor saturninus TaxID=64648 RepID=A0A8H7VBZ2_9FUNG|nr:hypothetical protein INT47_000062 [Mucor saturninus]
MSAAAVSYTVGILTVSDSASVDHALDKSGPLLETLLLETGKYTVLNRTVVPDEINAIQNIIKTWSNLHLVIITGGTGFSPRDVTPEAVKPLLTRETPGITHLLLSSSLAVTPFAALSRPVTGIRDKTMIITLPGSPKACQENMSAILNLLPHALDLLTDQKSVKQFHEKLQQQQPKEPEEPKQPPKEIHRCRHDREEDSTQLSGQSVLLETPVSRRLRSSPYPAIRIDRAIKIVGEHARRLNILSMPVSQFLPGYVLAENVSSLEPVPGYRASTVDGYAVHVEDGPGIYPVESVSLAQATTCTTLSRGKIARVTTGGMVPDGANAVVMVEDTKLIRSSEDGQDELEIEICASAHSGENIREKGSDCEVGQLIARQGQRVGSELGTLVSVGVRHVKVYRKPRVGVLSSGNEVLDHLHTDLLKPGQIRDTNRMTLLAAIAVAGYEGVDLGIVDDDVDEMTERLEEALSKVDVLITTGGVSMGEADFMKPILEQKMDATVHFGRVLMKPGKPTTFATVPQGKRGEKLVFALAGNPVSAMVGFHLFVVPALRRMAGWEKPEHGLVPVKIEEDIHLDARPEYHRVQVRIDHGGLVATSTGAQQSSRMLSLVEANGLLQLPMRTPEITLLRKGTSVPCILIGGLTK